MKIDMRKDRHKEMPHIPDYYDAPGVFNKDRYLADVIDHAFYLKRRMHAEHFIFGTAIGVSAIGGFLLGYFGGRSK